MTVIPVPAGPTIKEIIDTAFSAMGTSDVMFGHTETEYQDAVLALNGMMSEWPFNLLGYIIEDAAGLRLEEESGIDRTYMTAVAYSLAERMAPSFGKGLTAEARKIKNQTYSRLCGAVQPIPAAQFADNTPRGSGHRYYRRTYFPKAV